MKSKLLIFIMLMAPVAMQGQVRKFQIDAQSKSIVRSVKGDSVLVYTEVSPTETYFLLYVDGDPVAQAFQLLPGKYVQVRDVRIYDGKCAYFCGTRWAGVISIPYAVVGWFDINNVFSGTGSVEWGYFQSVPYSSSLLVTDMTRLDLFEYEDTVRMAMVGKTVYDWGTSQFPGTTVASAWLDGANWQIRVHPNRYLSMKFTDVACLEKTILAVGTTEEDTGCFVKPFRKVPDFPNQPLVPNVAQGLIYRSPIGEVLVDQVAHDSAVVAHYDNSSGACVVFHLLEAGSSTPVKTWLAPPSSSSAYNSSLKLKELNSNESTAYLLHTNMYPTSGYPMLSDWLLTLDYNNYPPASGPAVYMPLRMWRPQYGEIHSMDASAVQMRLSGEECSRLEVYGPHHLSKSACYDADNLHVSYGGAGIYVRDMIDEMTAATTPRMHEMPQLFETEVEVICEIREKEDEQ